MVERGEFLFVTGPSGAGKSTLLQLVYRQHPIDSGRILFSGRDIARRELFRARLAHGVDRGLRHEHANAANIRCIDVMLRDQRDRRVDHGVIEKA